MEVPLEIAGEIRDALHLSIYPSFSFCKTQNAMTGVIPNPRFPSGNMISIGLATCHLCVLGRQVALQEVQECKMHLQP